MQSLTPHLSLETPAFFLSEPVDDLIEFCERNIPGSTIARLKSGGQILLRFEKEDLTQALCLSVSSDGCYNGRVKCSEAFVEILSSLAREAPPLTINSCHCEKPIELHPTAHKFLTIGLDSIPVTKVTRFVLGK